MLSVAEAQARLLALASPLAQEQAPLAQSAGRWLAAPVHARRTQPATDLSAMDGYAIRFVDMPGPWRVTGESAAGGIAPAAIGGGEATRIFTGAPLPDGADAILIQEEAIRDGDRLALTGPGPEATGHFVRKAGSDFAEGAPLLAAGAYLTPAAIALAAIAGHGALSVRRRPRIALLSTGDELVAPGAPTPGALLPASNGAMLAAMLAGLPTEVADHGIVPDRLDALTGAFTAALADADIVVTTGGVSVGDHDLVRPALEQAGAQLDFWRVAMRPGKPLMAGRLGDAIILGLPGNPVSAYVTALLFLLPLVRHLAGSPDPLPETRRAPLDTALSANGYRAAYLRARLRNGRLEPMPSTDSAMLTELAQADALIVRAADCAPAAPGDPADYIPLR